MARHLFLQISFICSLFAQASFAQESVELIIQGANRQPLLSNPGSVEISRGEKLSEEHVTTVSELQIPNLTVAGGSPVPRFFQIRGIGEREQYEGVPNLSVGYIVDGVDLSSLGSLGTFFDAEQVEVLRGPQATLFGASALAGVINVVSREAVLLPERVLKVGIGTDELKEYGVALSDKIPGVEDLTFRVTSSALGEDGFRDNRFLSRDDTNHLNLYDHRLQLIWKPRATSKSDLWFRVAGHNNGYDAFSPFNGYSTYSDKPGADDLSAEIGSWKHEESISSTLRVSNQVSWYHSKNKYGYDADWGNDTLWSPFLPYDYTYESFRTRKQFSDELKVSLGQENPQSMRVDLGLFYRQVTESTSLAELFTGGPYRAVESTYRGDTYAGFAEVAVPLSSVLTFSQGLRFEWNGSEFSERLAGEFARIDRQLGGATSLSYALDNNSAAYLTARRGFKRGGFNTGTRVPSSLQSYEPESLWNFELGARGQNSTRSLHGSAHFFVGLRRDQQVQTSFQDDPTNPNSFTYITSNAARGRLLGAEAEGGFKVSKTVSFDLSGSVLFAEFTKYEDATRDLSGRDQSHAPRWQYIAAPTYQTTEDLSLTLRMRGSAAFFFDDSNNARSTPYHLLDAVAKYELGSWELLLWAKNIFNKRTSVRGFVFGLEPPDYPEREYVQRGTPRQVGLSAQVRF